MQKSDWAPRQVSEQLPEYAKVRLGQKTYQGSGGIKVRLGGTKVRLGGRYKVRLGATTLDRAGPKSDWGEIITFGRKSHTRKEIEAEVRLNDEALGKWKVERDDDVFIYS